jgi:hypothetical protein
MSIFLLCVASSETWKRLFVRPMDPDGDTAPRAYLCKLLRGYKSLVVHFFDVVSKAGTTNEKEGLDVITKLMRLIVETDRELAMAVAELRKHQEQQRRVEELQARVSAKDARIFQFTTQLRDAEQQLHRMLCEFRPKVDAVTQAEQSAIDPKELIAYAYVLHRNL